MDVNHMLAWADSVGLEFQTVVSCHVIREQQMLLTAEPSLQLPVIVLRVTQVGEAHT